MNEADASQRVRGRGTEEAGNGNALAKTEGDWLRMRSIEVRYR